MPEGPSIVILREETAKFAGQVVREVSGNSRQDIQRMAGQRVRAICSWGKHFLVVFDGFFLRVHFMLFGRYRVDALKENASPRLSLRFDNGELNLYACSVRFVEGDPDDTYDWRGDVMADAWDPALARRKLKALPRMLAADALLEQDVFAGVGNIIKNEVLWRIRVHPESTIGALPARRLDDLIREARAYSFDFLAWKKAFVLRKHYQVHTKSTCPRDGHKLTWRKHLGEKRRRAFFCELCQALYRDAADVAALAAQPDTVSRPKRKPASKTAPTKNVAARRAPAKKASATNATSKKDAPKNASAKKTAPKKTAPKTIAAKKTALNKIAPSKTAAKKAAAKKTSATRKALNLKKPATTRVAAKKRAAKTTPVSQGFARQPAAQTPRGQAPARGAGKKAAPRRVAAGSTAPQPTATSQPSARRSAGAAKTASPARRSTTPRPATGAPPRRAPARGAAGTTHSRR